MIESKRTDKGICSKWNALNFVHCNSYLCMKWVAKSKSNKQTARKERKNDEWIVVTVFSERNYGKTESAWSCTNTRNDILAVDVSKWNLRLFFFPHFISFPRSLGWTLLVCACAYIVICVLAHFFSCVDAAFNRCARDASNTHLRLSCSHPTP